MIGPAYDIVGTRGAERRALLWDAFIDMWRHIGRDFTTGWILWCALGDPPGIGGRRSITYPPSTRDQRNACRQLLRANSELIMPEDE